MNIAEILRGQAGERGNAVAIVDGFDRISFRELDTAAARTAAALRASGLKPGDTAIVFQPMSIQLYVLLIALFRLRVTAMFVDSSAGRRQLDRCVELVRPRAFIAIRKAHLLRLVSKAVRDIPMKIVASRKLPGATTATFNDAIEACDPDTPALLTFTSGSTGQPKGAVRTHGFLIAQHRAIAEDLDLTAGAIDLTTLPIFVLANLASGATSVIADADLRSPGAIDPARIVRQIWTTKPTRTVASPAFLDRLVSHAESLNTTLDSFHHIFTGGAPVFPKLLARAQSVMPSARIVSVYGSTEAEPIARVSWDEVSAADRSAMVGGAGLLAGKPVTVIDVRILPDRWGKPIGPFDDETFRREWRPTKSPGEIVVSGPHVLTGYFKGLGDSETKFRVGSRVWHRTGDAGYFDASGRLWLLGRCVARIHDAHGEIYPFAVECAAQAVPGVHRAALVAHQGQRLIAIELEPFSSLTVRADVHAAVQWATISHVVVLDRIPVDRRHNAKVDYPALRAFLEKRRQGTRDWLSIP